MKKIDEHNSLQIESLLNECKGNLFEFLVAQTLAKTFGSEGDFLLHLPADFRGRLQHYESIVRQYDLELLRNLPSLAVSVAKALEAFHPFSEKKEGVKMSFRLIGKLVATSDTKLWNETDIVLLREREGEGAQKYFLSLKLTRDHSYTNTKSAGAKSFIEKYFSSFERDARPFQERLNQEIDESFHMMGYKLYSLIDQEFEGRFDTRWSDHYSELPGELPEEMKEIVHYNYHRVAVLLHTFLKELHALDSEKFYQSLHALCGFGNESIIQVHCFHQESTLKDILIKNHRDLFSGDPHEIELKDLGPKASAFDIAFKKFVLQIRVKPMNKFTTPAYKINCSIKMKGEKNE